MKRYLAIVLSLALALACVSCSKMQQAKRAYKKGDYQKAVSLFEEVLAKEATNTTALTYVVLAKSGVMADQAAAALAQGSYAEAFGLLDQAIALDSKNIDAQTLLNKTCNAIAATIQSSLYPAKQWAAIIPLADLVIQHQPGQNSLLPVYAEAVFHAERDTFTYKAVQAIEKAFAVDPNNAFLKAHKEAIDTKSAPYKKRFEAYMNALSGSNINTWKSIIHPTYWSQVIADVKRFMDNDDPEIKGPNDFFRFLCEDHKKNCKGEDVKLICVEPLSDTHGFIHFSYKGMSKYIKMEVEKMGGELRLYREEDSEIKK